MKKIIYFIDCFKFVLAFIIKNFLKDNDDIFLIGERKDEAQDNGYHLFKYIREKYPNEKVYYVITKSSKDFKKVSIYSNVIKYNSLKHYIYILKAKKFICGHLGSCFPDTPVVWKAREKNIISGKRVFIQHGITISEHEALKYKSNSIDEFICGAAPEYDFVNSKFGYPDGSVKYLGFCRFDNLHKLSVKNQILIMPTWRGWLGETWCRNSEDEFLKSKYYKKLNSLINSTKLINFLEENNINLIFYPHYEMQKYLKFFYKTSKNIIIANKETFDVQSLLIESKLLITDYSSVAFDFAYMKKKILYYQFDSDEYYKNHYKKGYFDYERNGFGDVFSEEDKIIEELINIYELEINKKYEKRINEFFRINDVNNCERNYLNMIKG